MLTVKPQMNLQNAREYFREHLCVGDYYSADQKVRGEWFGKGAERLGRKGSVKESDFLALCEGMDPRTGERLTARKNSERDQDGWKVANRRVFYDVTLSPPKSVSVVALMQDDRILWLHEKAVRQALVELEKFAETRVRKLGQQGERVTGNVVGAAFRHDTSRELDPHVHTHCVLFNASFDPVERRWKALEVQGMYRAQKFAENFYYHELAKGLEGLGYPIQNNARDFEIKGVSRAIITRFSKRHQQIDVETERRITESGTLNDRNSIRRQVAQEKRKRKMKDSTAERLRPMWQKQIPAEEHAALRALSPARPAPLKSADIPGLVAWADECLFERRSVVYDHELLSAALARGRGQNFDLAELREGVLGRGYIQEVGTAKVTSREVLRTEWEIILAARDGRGRHKALAPGGESGPSLGLSPEQLTAVNRILGSRDFITLFRGGAGTGKSRALTEVERKLAATGRPVVVLAPQGQQVQDLQKEGLPARTLAEVLAVERLPQHAVVLVDEAGQIGGRDLHALIGLVRAHFGRLILSGDTRQHGAVAASDALRAIERHAQLKPAEIRTIRRQNPALGASRMERAAIRTYRAAVKDAAAGRIAESFARLDGLGWVREWPEARRREALAAEYLAALGRRESALVVAQTRDEVHGINEAIREKLKEANQLGPGVRLVTFIAETWEEAQKRDSRFYAAGHCAFFHRSYGRFAKGDLCEIVGAADSGLTLLKDGRCSSVSYRYADRLSVAHPKELEIAPGDRLQLKFNGRSAEGRPLSNGELVTVRRTLKDGRLVVTDESGVRKTLGVSQRLFSRGFAVTSYGSQGKTVDTVFLADAASRAATSAEQWYVSISRARKRVLVFTSDATELRANIVRSGGRELALDLDAALPPEWSRSVRAAIERMRLHRSIRVRAENRLVRSA